MKKMISLCAVSAAFAGCGGGGSAGAPPTPPVPVPVTLAQAAYVGTWVSDCWGHNQETIVVSMAPNGSLTASSEINWFARVGCAGPSIATEKMNANFSVTYTDTVDATFPLGPGVGATTVKVDRVTWTVPAFSRSVTGSGATPTASPDLICIAITDAETPRVSVGSQPGYSKNAGLHTAGNEMFILSADGNTYKVDVHYTKKP
jgi:hypothetical protein